MDDGDRFGVFGPGKEHRPGGVDGSSGRSLDSPGRPRSLAPNSAMSAPADGLHRRAPVGRRVDRAHADLTASLDRTSAHEPIRPRASELPEAPLMDPDMDPDGP